MRKLTLVIIAIACVEIAFLAFLSARRQAEVTAGAFEVASVRTPTRVMAPDTPEAVVPPDPPDIAEAATSLTEKPVSPGRGDEPRARVRHRPEVRADRVLTAKLRPRTRKRTPAFPSDELASLRVPADVVILYTAPQKKLVRKPSTAVHAEKVRPITRDRSFLARLMPIVKKPYNWIKALGSKLN